MLQDLLIRSLEAALLVRALERELAHLLAYLFYFRVLQHLLLAHWAHVLPLERALQAKPAAAVRGYALHHVLVADFALCVLVRVPQFHSGNRGLYLLYRVRLFRNRKEVRRLNMRQPAFQLADKMRILIENVRVRLVEDQETDIVEQII